MHYLNNFIKLHKNTKARAEIMYSTTEFLASQASTGTSHERFLENYLPT